jgi:transposase
MARARLCMRISKEILRLRYAEGKSEREIRDILGLKSKTTVHRCVERAEKAGIGWPLPESMSEDNLEMRLFPRQPARFSGKAPIDFAYVHEQMQHKFATKMVLWQEYTELHPGNHYGYTQFSELYNKWAGYLNYSMRQTYRAGEKVFVDFGSGLEYIDRETGEYVKTHMFVAVLGASKYTYTEAVLSQDLPAWISANRRMLEYFDGVSETIVPDNLKAAVEKASLYEPLLNRTYAEFARHYGSHVAPTRPKEPRDKAHVENGVKLVKRWILFRLRNEKFFSLHELNAAVRALLEKFNAKVMKKIGKSRKELFLTLDKPNMSPLPETPFEFAEWKEVKPGPDYHVSFEKQLYSVPYTLIGKKLEIKATDTLIEVYLKGERVCSHRRKRGGYEPTTVPEHMPESHREVSSVTSESLKARAERIGPDVLMLVEAKLGSGRFEQHAYRSCLGILRLGEKYGLERLNKACKRGLHYRSMSYDNISTILKHKLEEQEYEKPFVSRPPLKHANIRGKEEYEKCLFEN